MAEAPSSANVNRWVLLVVVMIGTFMSVLDTSIMNVAIPYIMSFFGANVEQAQWITAGFLISSAVVMPLTSWLGRRIGYGNLYLLVLSIFTVGALASATAVSLNGLIIARVVQGAGAGIVHPASIAILTRALPFDRLGTGETSGHAALLSNCVVFEEGALHMRPMACDPGSSRSR